MQSNFEKLIGTPAEWLVNGEQSGDIVLSSRVRLARNLEGKKFTHSSTSKNLKEIRDAVKDAVLDTDYLKKALPIDMDDISESERMVLAERRLISQEMVMHYKDRSLVASEDEQLGVMINEEDHMRLYAIGAGLMLEDVGRILSSLDDQVSGRLNYAFSPRFGYLTACPTNVGTGMRVSSLLHLPGLVHNNDIRKVVDGMRHVRLSVRGTYGEGSEVIGNFFQISNSITLGLSEEETIRNMEGQIGKVVEFEKRARDKLIKEARTLLEDKVSRSLGILRSARLIDSKEAMKLLSDVRMGVGMGLISEVKMNVLNELLITIQPMHLQMTNLEVLDPEQRDIARADHLRSVLK
ncbi:MAG: ATP--guanido phosphotransferase [Candidatus Latescibacteria bacterium]|nr:ATP--guanido phosphotransferase [bacterium]MBD3423672.1 ATP--guanido phosphotransferase [Candidatus Latescibacterota bacterium]